MDSRKCAECGGAISASRKALTVELRGATITVPDLEHAACTQCGEVYLDLDAMDRLQKEAVRQFKLAKGLLTPEEIRTLRHSLGLSQAAFEDLLGVGSKTVVRWERGTVFQSATADRLMRLIRAMPEVTAFLRESGTEAPESNSSLERNDRQIEELRRPGQ